MSLRIFLKCLRKVDEIKVDYSHSSFAVLFLVALLSNLPSLVSAVTMKVYSVSGVSLLAPTLKSVPVDQAESSESRKKGRIFFFQR